MSDAEARAQLTELRAEFQRVADRAGWVRAAFSIKAGRIAGVGFGRPVAGEAFADSSCDPICVEVDALTERAGGLIAEACPQLSPAGGSWRGMAWLLFLLHCPYTTGHCQTKDADGRMRFALLLLGANEIAVCIDRYPGVCVSALTRLLVELPAAQQDANAPPASLVRKLSSTERKILAYCRRAYHKGERIALHLGVTFDHARRLLARLVKEGRLQNTERGYRTV
jgi:hypothetical protein